MHESYTLPKYFFCGGVGRIFGVTLGYPLDTIKVRLQTMPVPAHGEPPLYTGMIDCFIKTVKTEGFRSLYRGITAPLVISVPLNSILFFGYGLGHQLVSKDVDAPSMLELFLAGAFSASFGTLLIAPAEHVKILLQVSGDSSPPKYKGTIDCLKQLYAQGGIGRVYKGTKITLFRDVPATGVFFMSYDSIKDVIISEKTSPSNKMVASVLSGGLAGMSYWIMAMPADTLKTRFQSAPEGKYKGLMDAFKQLMVAEGLTGFYAGLTPVIIRAFPVNAITFLGFEVGTRVYDWVVADL